LEGVPKDSKVAEETVVRPSRMDNGTPKVARYLDEAGGVGRVTVAQGGKANRFTPDLMGENLCIDRGGAGDGPMADKNRFAHAEEHELNDFNEMMVGKFASGEEREQVSDILRAVVVCEQAFVVGSEISIVVGFGDPACIDVIHGGVSTDLSDGSRMDAPQVGDPVYVVPDVPVDPKGPGPERGAVNAIKDGGIDVNRDLAIDTQMAGSGSEKGTQDAGCFGATRALELAEGVGPHGHGRSELAMFYPEKELVGAKRLANKITGSLDSRESPPGAKAGALVSDGSISVGVGGAGRVTSDRVDVVPDREIARRVPKGSKE